MLLVPFSRVQADSVVAIPDPNLEVAIREAIDRPSGYIYQSDLSGSTFTTLHADGSGIQYLTGLQYCTSLRYLYLDTNQISNISALAGLTSLKVLHLQANRVSDIHPLSGLTNLTDLRLYENQISDISPLADLTSLTVLYLSSNQISDISPLADLTSLTDLYLYWNQISDISPLAGLTNLTDLRLPGNQIGDISPLAGLTNLTDLRLYQNQISDISPLSGLTSLRVLYLGLNQISDISPLSGLTSLTELRLYENQISDIQPLVDNPGIASGDVLHLITNPLSCESQHQYVPLLLARGVTLDWEGTNQTPTRPSNLSPLNGSVGAKVTPTLKSSAFSDPDTCDACGASQWQVTDQSGDYSALVFDSKTDAKHLTSITIPSLSRYTTYYWRVRHQDGLGAWSEWSAETSFTTRAHAGGGLPVWIWPIVGVAVVAVAVGGFFLLRRRANPS